MNDTNRTPAAPIRVRRYVWLLVGLWTVAVGGALCWELVDEWNQGLEIARAIARGAIEKEFAFRHWNASHGGVYVEVNEKSPPNPYLNDISERDVTTASNRRLTLVNPAYMMRQVHEASQGRQSLQGHLTSLRPIRPENQPDAWEREALEKFERGVPEWSTREEIDGKPHMRLMRPLITEARCLTCHGQQGYQVGDVRGGISVSVPMDTVWAAQGRAMTHQAAGYGGIWLFGLCGIAMASRRFRRQIEHRHRAEDALRETQARIRETAANIPGVVYQFLRRPDGTYTFPYVSEGVTQVLGISPEEVQQDPTALLPGEKSAKTMGTWQRELQCKSTGGEIKWVRAISNPHPTPDGSVLWNGVFLDVTDLKQTQAELQRARDSLEERVAERTAELEQANQELQKEIAERAQAEQWLLESEERFRSYFELGLVGMAIVSPEKEWMEVNQRLCEILGYSEAELTRKTWTDLTHPDDREADETELGRVLNGVTKGYSLDRRFVCKDGKVVDAHLCVRRLRRADGAIDSLLVLVHDITKRKQAEDALRRSQAFLQTVIDAVPDVTLVIDRDFRVVLANQAARERAGGKDPVADQVTCYELFHGREAPCEGECGPCSLQRVLETRCPVTVVQTRQAPDGRESIFEINAAPILAENGEVVQIVESSRDVTERTRAAEALHESSEKYRALVDEQQFLLGNMSDFVYRHDREGKFYYLSPAVEQITGYSVDQWGTHYTKYLTDNPINEHVVRATEETLRTGKPSRPYPVEIYHKDGRRITLEVNERPFFEGGEVAGIIGVARDVTDRKRAEEAAEAAQEALLNYQLRETERVAAELDKVRDQLVRQTRLATIGQIVAQVTNELRNPLGAIRNAAFLLEGKVPPTEPACREYIQIIEQEANSAGQIIADLSAMSRGKEPVRKPVDLSTIVTEARSRVVAPESIQWHDTYQPDPFVINVDAAQWEQVLRNLFANSVYAVGGAGGISLMATRSSDHDEIVISDDGPGIPPERRHEVFEPLSTDKAQGTGLGLTICRQIVQQHGGTIETIDSDRGAAFCIRLPRVDEQPARA